MNRRAFSLLELVIVLCITSILGAAAVSIFQPSANQTASTAEKLATTLKLLRQYAIDHHTSTRLVFASDELVQAFPQKKLRTQAAWGAYVFHVPELSVTTIENAALGVELLHRPLMARPSGFVGQWIPWSQKTEWEILPQNLTFTSPLFEQNVIPQHDASLIYWSSTGTDVTQPSPYSFYPQNYYQIPFPSAYPLTSASVDIHETSPVTLNGAPLLYVDTSNPAQSLWPTNLVTTFFQGTDPSKLGSIEISGTSSRRFFYLPCIEFDSEGKPTFQWTDNLVIRCSDQLHPDVSSEVSIGRSGNISIQTLQD